MHSCLRVQPPTATFPEYIIICSKVRCCSRLLKNFSAHLDGLFTKLMLMLLGSSLVHAGPTSPQCLPYFVEQATEQLARRFVDAIVFVGPTFPPRLLLHKNCGASLICSAVCRCTRSRGIDLSPWLEHCNSSTIFSSTDPRRVRGCAPETGLKESLTALKAKAFLSDADVFTDIAMPSTTTGE